MITNVGSESLCPDQIPKFRTRGRRLSCNGSADTRCYTCPEIRHLGTAYWVRGACHASRARWPDLPDRKISVKMQTRNAGGRNSHNGGVSGQELRQARNRTNRSVLSDEDVFLHHALFSTSLTESAASRVFSSCFIRFEHTSTFAIQLRRLRFQLMSSLSLMSKFRFALVGNRGRRCGTSGNRRVRVTRNACRKRLECCDRLTGD